MNINRIKINSVVVWNLKNRLLHVSGTLITLSWCLVQVNIWNFMIVRFNIWLIFMGCCIICFLNYTDEEKLEGKEGGNTIQWGRSEETGFEQ